MNDGQVSQKLKSNHEVGHSIRHSLVWVRKSTVGLNLEYLESLLGKNSAEESLLDQTQIKQITGTGVVDVASMYKQH